MTGLLLSPPEFVFKLVFVAAFVTAAATATRTARRAIAAHGGTVNQLQHEANGLIAIRATLGLLFYAALLAWWFTPGSFRWMYLPVPAAVRWTAVLSMVPVMLFFVWAFRSIGTNYRGGVGLYERHALVTSGAYRWMRHPIYAAFIGIMLLVGPLSANWLLGASGLALVVAIPVIRVPIEERELRERFGSTWDTYRQQHRGLL